MDAIVNGLAALPPTAMNSSSGKTSRMVSRRLTLPPQRLANNDGSKAMMLTKAALPAGGFVLDYQTVSGSLTNFTFQGDLTYYISGYVDLYGTNIFEGGTVIKFDTNGSLVIDGALNCRTGPYRPALFTSKDDNSIGETITGSSGTPTIGGSVYISVINDYLSNLRYLRFAYAGGAIQADNENIWHSQFVHCNRAIDVWHNISLYNVLFAQCQYAMSPIYGGTIVGEHLTTDSNLMDGSTTTLCLTNCILANDVNASTINASSSISSVNLYMAGITQVSGPLFQTVGAGSYYLTNNSPGTNFGTTNIDASLLVDLRQKTTYPPVLYTNLIVSTNITLSPQTQRDTDIPDVGYHYDPIDYLVDLCWITNAALTVNPGTAIACYNDSGLIITDGSSINSIGTPLAPNWFTIYSCVQEQPILLGSTPGNGLCINSYHAITPPNGQYRFSKFSCMASWGYILYHSSNWTYNNLAVQDCEFWGGKNDLSGNNSSTAVLKNNLFARSPITSVGNFYSNNSLIASNNLFWNLSFTVRGGANSNSWIFFNNDFDNTAISRGTGTQLTANGYNGYIGNTNRLQPVSVNDVISTNAIAYQSGPLGYFYQPTNSILANTGSCTADLAALYHYTTTTNEVKETNSIVDIGYHYVALDGNGNPIDTDGDGVPDYLEDTNGNGIVDPGEGDWTKAELGIWISRPQGLSTP